VGSLACFALCLPFTRDGLAATNIANFTGTFLVTAAFLALVGLPAVMLLPATMRGSAAGARPGPYRRILATLSEWRRDRNVPMLLLAYYLVNDGLVAVVFFTALTFRRTFGLDVLEILMLSLLVQLVAIPATIFFGWLGDRWSQRGAIYGTLTLWLMVLILMVRTDGWDGALAVTATLGLVVGSTQSLFRSLFAAMVPIDRAAEYFGFHTLVGRAAAAFAPLVFGIVSVATGSQRAAMASLAVFFVAGAMVLTCVRVPAR
jgi:UMF1 family MFS transporter